MTDSQDSRTLWLEFLKIFTRALVQINLYKPDHPQVRQALLDGEALLGRIHADGGDFSITLAADKLLINSTPLLSADKLPNSIKNLFSRFRIQTITFVQGASGADLLALCQLQAHKGDGRTFLAERGVEKITLNEDVYAKVDQAAPPQAAASALRRQDPPRPRRRPKKKLPSRSPGRGLKPRSPP